MRKYNNYDLHFVFETKDNISFLNMKYIHPLKQALVADYIREFQNDKNIKAVIIFGSSVEFRCNSYSDLDICIERYDTEKFFHKKDDFEETDIVYIDSVGDRLRQEIEQKGIVVFDREGKYV